MCGTSVGIWVSAGVRGGVSACVRCGVHLSGGGVLGWG